jgi:hypothetical protein
MTAGNFLSDRIFQGAIVARQLDLGIEKAIVDASYFNRPDPALMLSLSPAVTGHTFQAHFALPQENGSMSENRLSTQIKKTMHGNSPCIA